MKKPGGNISVEKSLDSFSDRTGTLLGSDMCRTEQFTECIASVSQVLMSLLPDVCNKYVKFVRVFVE